MLLGILIETAFVLVVATDGAIGKSVDPLRWHTNNQPSNLVALGSTSGTSDGWFLSKRFDSANCTGSPIMFIAGQGCEVSNDASEQCISDEFGSTSGSLDPEALPSYYAFDCVVDVSVAVTDSFGGNPFLRINYYADTSCTELETINVYAADGECHNLITGSAADDLTPMSWRITVNANGTVSTVVYSGYGYDGDVYQSQQFTRAELQAGNCSDSEIASSSTALISASASSSSGNGSDKTNSGESGTSAGSIVRVAAGCVALMAVIVAIVL